LIISKKSKNLKKIQISTLKPKMEIRKIREDFKIENKNLKTKN